MLQLVGFYIILMCLLQCVQMVTMGRTAPSSVNVAMEATASTRRAPVCVRPAGMDACVRKVNHSL